MRCAVRNDEFRLKQGQTVTSMSDIIIKTLIKILNYVIIKLDQKKKSKKNLINLILSLLNIFNPIDICML